MLDREFPLSYRSGMKMLNSQFSTVLDTLCASWLILAGFVHLFQG